MTLSRRDFLARTLGGSTLLAAGATLPAFLARTAGAAGPFLPGRERILVCVEMTGGNDGLNTVIPFRDDAYRRARPTLAVPAAGVLRLDDDLGLHPGMEGLRSLHDEGWLAVVENVGYPNPNRSHFTSMDIWHTARLEPGARRTGWLGRVADIAGTGREAPFALHLDERALPLALQTEGRPVPSIGGIAAFRLREEAHTLAGAIEAPRADCGEDLQFVQRTAIQSLASARRLEHAVRGREEAVSPYPPHGLARKLREIARLIGAEFGPRVYYTSIGGFDTHARQAASHPALLRELADSVRAFFRDLAARRLADRVVLLTFSEFGRRVKENASLGTDHGAAAPLFLAGPGVRGGIHGGRPDLGDLVRGDVRHRFDFRRVYAAVLESWLGVEPSGILGRRFEPLPLFARKGKKA